ncbi:MAG: hypothetical protein JKY10_12305 [Cohaesibacteraceae bacterium]|nr:hypothetical protein [Cohaesibacteraceae bacterium]
MNNITLAGLFAEKFIRDMVPDIDPRKYYDYEFFISAIVKLIEEHPYVKQVISNENLTLSNVLAATQSYFENHQSKRGFEKENLVIVRRFVRTSSKFRHYETSTLLLTIGFPLLWVFLRLCNSDEATNNFTIGDKFEKEYPDPDNPNPFPIVMIDEQYESSQIKRLYQMIQNQNTPYSVICSQMLRIDHNLFCPSKKIDEARSRDTICKSINKRWLA